MKIPPRPIFQGKKGPSATAIFLLNILLCLATPFALHGQNQSAQIGLLMDNLKFERWQRDSKLIQARARELGVKVAVKDAEGNDDLQLQQANQLIDAGVMLSS